MKRSYQVFKMNYSKKEPEMIAVLLERRKDLRGEAQLASALKWAKKVFGRLVTDPASIFVIPK